MRFPDNIVERVKRNGSAVQLAIFRILLGLYVFYISTSKLFHYIRYVYQGNVTTKRSVFPGFIDSFAFDDILLLNKIVMVSAVMFMFGFAYRVTSIVLAVSFLLMYDAVYLAQGTHSQWPYLWFALCIMMFARASDVLSIDSILFRKQTTLHPGLKQYRWPIEAMVLWLAILYFWAGMAKILPVWEGIIWLQGGTVKYIVYNRFLYSPAYFIFGKPLFNYAESFSWAYSVLAIFTVVAELAGILLLLTRRFNLLFVFLIVLLHGGIYLIGVGDFLLVSLLTCFCLIDPSRFQNLDNKLRG